mgnify:CR=1 FL=1
MQQALPKTQYEISSAFDRLRLGSLASEPRIYSVTSSSVTFLPGPRLTPVLLRSTARA